MTGKEFNEAFDELSRYLVGYDDMIMQLKLAFLTRSHLLINGRTGAGKSYAARTALGLISGASVFRTQVSAFSIPDHLIGAMIPEKYLSSGEQIYNLTHGLADTDLALLDEFTDISDVLAKSLNTVLHERIFETKDMRTPIPLHTVLMTSNAIPAAKSWEPVLARILFQYEAENVHGYYDRFRMQKVFEESQGAPPVLAKVPFEDVKALYRKVKEMHVPDGVHFLLAYVAEEYSKTIADRPRALLCGRENTALVDVIRAAAVLEDREVTYSHLRSIKYALCTMGASEEGAREQQILEEIIAEALPQAKHLSAETKTYDGLGSLAAQMASAQSNGKSASEKRFMLPFDFVKNAKFAWLAELESYMAEVSGRVSFHSARALANDLRRQVSILASRSKRPS
jgi:MoxR-like ATPase